MEIYKLIPPEPLTEEEKKSPYAEIYDLPIHDPAPEILENFMPGKTMDPAKAFPVTELERLFTPGAMEQENGYCLLPDGTGFSTVHVKMPNATPEMEAIWSAGWLTESDVNYKVWFPGFHISHQMPVIEDLGWGRGIVDFACPLILPKLLSAPPEQLDPNFIGFSGCSGYFTLLDNPEDKCCQTIANCMRKTPDGSLEEQTIVWFGTHYIDGKAIKMLPDGEMADIERVRLFGCHNAWENTRKGEILPLIAEIKKSL
ncbi:MAG: hypothetical protein LUB60_00895 [Clostridiales bacterium]|nr:hypothetical protein [Clostridiales bacterium]